MNVPCKWKGTPEQAEKRTMAIMRGWKEQSDLVPETLDEIHDRKLWAIHYKSFREFLEKGCGISRSWGYEMIQRQKVLAEPPIEDTNRGSKSVRSPDTESETNKAIPQKNSPMPEKTVHRENGKKEKNIGESKIIELDSVGYPIPEEAIEFWHRASEVQGIMTAVSKAKTALEDAKGRDDPLFRAVSKAAIDHLSRAYQYLTDAKPYAVCLYCQGHYNLNKGCLNCKGVGLVSKFSYEKNAPEELRIIRERSIEGKK